LGRREEGQRGACAPSGTVQGAAFGGENAKVWNTEKGQFAYKQ